MYRYRFIGDAPEWFSDHHLFADRELAEGQEPGEVRPDDEVETDEPILHARLEPLDDATAEATDALADANPQLVDELRQEAGIPPVHAQRGDAGGITDHEAEVDPELEALLAEEEAIANAASEHSTSHPEEV